MRSLQFDSYYAFCGSGGGAYGFQQSVAHLFDCRSTFRVLGGFDVDPKAVANFEYLTGVAAMLADARVKMEQYFQDNRAYPAGCTNTTPVAAGNVLVQTLKNFTLTCVTDPPNNTYTVTATGTGPVAGFTYTINQNNVKTSAFSGTGASAGWTAASPNNCWVIRKGGVC